MRRLLLSVLLFVGGLSAQGQTNMPYTGVDSSSACSGTLYDHAGPSGNYSNSAWGTFYLQPTGGTLTITFTSFSLESCCDRVRVYDGIGTSGTLLVNQGGYSLPNGGSAITVPSGNATIVFTSDGSVVSSGFAMNWTSSGGTSPSSSFTMSTTNPPLNWPVNFTNTSSGGGTFAWDFGDGNTSTTRNPTHTYTTPGTYSVQLITSGCLGTPDTATQTVTVQGNPSYTVVPDSLYSSVSCGGVASGSFTLNGTGAALGYTVSSREVPAPPPFVLNEGFESSFGAFYTTPGAYANFNASRVISSAPQGNTFMQLTGSTINEEGVRADFAAAQPNSISFHINPASYTSGQGYISVVGNGAIPWNSRMFYAQVRYTTLRVYTGSGTLYISTPQNSWTHIEVKNIDWVNHTYEIYADGVQQGSTAYAFYTTVNSVEAMNIWTGSSVSNLGVDAVQIGYDVPEPLTLSSTSGFLNPGNSASINATLNTNGMIAGTYNYEIVLRTNASGNDSLKIVPFIVDVTGSPTISLDKSCINFGNLYTTLSFQDSIRIVNTGCDSLDISSIVSTDPDITTDVSQLMVPPFDTAFLHVDVSPSTAGAYNDTIYLTNNASNLAVCVTGTGLASPIGRMDSSSFNLVSNGCNDSLNFGFYLYNDGAANLTWSASSTSLISDDFDAGTTPSSIWQSIGTNLIGSHCWSNSGTNSLAMYGNNRYAVTNTFMSTGNDSVTFWARPGFSSSPCEDPDGSETLWVDYSTDGVLWYSLGSVSSYLNTPTYFALHIPVTGNVQVRFRQTSYSSATIDNYIIDDFEVKGANARFTFNPSSGSVLPVDSVWVNVTVNISDLTSGVYNYPMVVQTNDPSNPTIITNVQVTVNGDPQIALDQSGCLDLGSLINGNSITDSIAIFNNGCADLNLTGFSSTNSDFSASSDTNVVAPGDTAYLIVDFTSNAIGTYNDTITISNNDTVQYLCVTAVGVGAPNFDVDPDSIYVSTTNCSDSIFVPITISNQGGLSTLHFTIDSLQGGNGSTLNLTVLKTGADVGREYPYTMSAITTYLPNANVTESMAISAAALTADLANADVLLIPEQEYLSTFETNALRPAIQSYVSNGGQVVVLANSQAQLFDLFTVSSTTTSAPTYLNIPDPTHPVFAGTNTSAFVNTGLIRSYTITSPNVQVLGHGYNTTNHTVALVPYGSGNVIYYGYDFYWYNSDIQQGLANSIQFLKDENSLDWAYSTLYQDSTQANDSTTFGIVMLASGLANGTHTGSLTIHTNDPNYPSVDVPFVLDLNGEAEMSLPTACLDFDSAIVGVQLIDTTTVWNTGCDTLHIGSYSSATGDYAIASGLPIRIGPGDSARVAISFNPSSMGVLNDTLQFLALSDTVGLCVNGRGLGAPVLSTASDTLEVIMNKCDNFGIENYSIANTGQGAMTYDIFFGRYFMDTSYTAYTANYATTSHSFTPPMTTADSIVVTVIYQGDFDWWNEYITLNIEGVFIGNTQNTYTNFGTPDTAKFVVTGANVGTFLADGTLNLDIQNSNYVTYTSSYVNFHDVTVEVYDEGLPSWLAFPSATTGTLGIGGSVNKSLIFTATNLTPGVYSTDMNILTNDPTQLHKIIPILFDVRDEATMRLSDTCVTVPVTQVGDTGTVSLWVVNDGCQPLNVTNITSGINVFSASPKIFSVPAGDSVMVTVSFIPTSPATYNTNMTVVSNAGSQQYCVNATSTALPTAGFQFSVIDQCDGQVLFSDHSSGTVTSYNWTFGDGNFSQSPNPTHSYEKPGTYKVTMTVSNSSGFDTISDYITVNPLYVGFGAEMNGWAITSDTLYVNTPVNFSDSSITASQWTWYFGDGGLSNSQNPTHTYTNIGVYQVTLDAQDTAGCRKIVSQAFWVVNGIGLEEQATAALKVFPNPSSGLFTITNDGRSWEGVHMSVANLGGEIISQMNADSSLDQQRIDLSELPAGVYVLRITSDEGWSAVRRLIRQ